jgi:hypothetical protein
MRNLILTLIFWKGEVRVLSKNTAMRMMLAKA